MIDFRFRHPAALITGVYDGYDALKEVCPQVGFEGDVDYVCVTDSERLVAESGPILRDEGFGIYADGLRHPTGWRIVYLPAPGVHPNRAAKVPKMQPQDFTSAPASVWLDASFRVVSSRFVADLINHADRSPHGLAQFKHPWRSCLFDEAAESAPMPKYAGEPIEEQTAKYRADGMPERWGLWATGIIGRVHSPELTAWGNTWLEHCRTWSIQDQISHPYVTWKHGIRPAELPGTHLGNPWIAYEGSFRHVHG